MFYRVIGIMSGSSLDGLDIAFVEFEEAGGRWNFEIKATSCKPYSNDWYTRLQHATSLPAYDYILLHADYGRYIAEEVNAFIDDNNLHHKVQIIASHGHTTFHEPYRGFTSQLGDGAAIAAITQINVVSDLRALDVAFGGQGAPIVPVGEKFLFSDFQLCLNLGGIANLSYKGKDGYIAFDVCSANRVLNMLAQLEGKEYDKDGTMAALGKIDISLLTQLNILDYYKRPFPKSLPNSFGTDVVFPIIQSYSLSVQDKLRTYIEHISTQIHSSLQRLLKYEHTNLRMLVTGGGAFNSFLIARLKQMSDAYNIEVVVPDEMIINYKEALIMAFIGVLRWREEYTVLNSVTGAKRSSIGGAVWIGQEA